MVSDPPLVLAFDTSAAHCAAVLVRGDRVLARRDEAMDRGQAERLLPMLEELLAEAGLGWRDLDGIGVCTGPGNFTGLRIAVAAARGLALALGIPAVGVTRFEALGRPAGPVLVDASTTAAAAASSRPSATARRDRPAGASTRPALAAAGRRRSPTARRRALPTSSPLARDRRARRLGRRRRPPAPLYLRPADAMPPPEPPPALLDDA